MPRTCVQIITCKTKQLGKLGGSIHVGSFLQEALVHFSKMDASWEIFEQHVKTLFKKLTLGCQWVFNIDSRLYCIS